MKKLIVALLLLSGCVPAGYVKDPAKEPATKADVQGLRQAILQDMQSLYQALKPAEAPTPVAAKTPAPAKAKK